MNKIQKWLIHKLGGFSELPLSVPEFARKPYKIEPIYAVHYLKRDEYEYLINTCKDVIAKEIAKELLKSNLIDIKEFDMLDGTIGIRAKVYIVRSEEE